MLFDSPRTVWIECPQFVDLFGSPKQSKSNFLSVRSLKALSKGGNGVPGGGAASGRSRHYQQPTSPVKSISGTFKVN